MKNDTLKVALCQMAPVWLDRIRTLEKMAGYVEEASQSNCDLIIFGEGLVPGYPFWVEYTDGAKFESDLQKDLFAHYLNQAIVIERGDLEILQSLSRKSGISILTGTIEAAKDRGGHSVYCSLVYIVKGEIVNVHRKLMPTYEERLVWASGDGNGLNTFPIGSFTLGALNCWKNWVPLARTALYAQGEDLHIAIWPGSVRNTVDITRWIAKESRSYVISVCSLMRKKDIPVNMIHYELLEEKLPDIMADGGSCIADPTGTWLIEPLAEKEGLIIAEIDHTLVRKERQNFDPTGHYSRPDVLKLELNKERQSGIQIR